MREILDDAEAHKMDGFGRAQHHTKIALPKRFYKQAKAMAKDGGFTVALDGRGVKTPGLLAVVVPNKALADALAVEWSAQEEFINPATMPLTRLVNSAIEGGEKVVPALREEVIKFAGNDLLYYRAETPEVLVTAQENSWDKALATLAKHFEVKFKPTVGIIHQAQPEETMARLTVAVADIELLPITALVSLTGLTGSGLLAIGIHYKLFSADEVWATAHVDEDHNIRLWGEDFEAKARRETRRKEYDAAMSLLALVTD